MNWKINWDALGVGASLACAIHCAVLPLIITSLPILGIEIVDNAWFELMMIFIGMAIGTWSLWHGYKKHHNEILPVVLFSGGMLLLFAKQVWHDYQLWILPFAVVLIITAHILNYRYCRVRSKVNTADQRSN